MLCDFIISIIFLNHDLHSGGLYLRQFLCLRPACGVHGEVLRGVADP